MPIRPRLHLPALVGVALLAVTLSACAGSPGSTPTTAAPTPTTKSTPVASVTPVQPSAAPVALPTDCATLGTESSWQETVGDMTLQSDGTGFVRDAPANATLALGCDWIIDEVAGVLLLISTASDADVTAGVATLPGLGYTCSVSDDFGADYCELPGAGDDSEDIVVARDGVWIYLETVNRNGRAFISDIAQQIWG